MDCGVVELHTNKNKKFNIKLKPQEYSMCTRTSFTTKQTIHALPKSCNFSQKN